MGLYKANKNTESLSFKGADRYQYNMYKTGFSNYVPVVVFSYIILLMIPMASVIFREKL